ncbi:MAG: PadR family transcriptional regulator [Nocardioides sp.]
MSRPGRLTTTSYALLGLLSLRSWTTYELAQQMGRSLDRIWPRAESKLYEEPKKLVAHGLARARPERVGQRPRTRYAITARGRRALRRWLAEPGEGPVLEAEQLLQLLFAHQGSRADALATLAAARAWAVEQNADNLAVARSYFAGEGEFQAHAAQNLLVGGFLTELYRLVAQWADWATALAQQWPDDPGAAVPDRAAQAHVVRRAEWSETGRFS